MANYTVPLFVLQNERQQVYRQRKLLENLSGFEIIPNCGMSYWGVSDLIGLYSSLEGQYSTEIPLETKVLTYMICLRSGNFQWSMGSFSGTSQKSASRIIEACTNITLDYSQGLVGYPPSIDEMKVLKQRFFTYGKLPNVISIIEGTHVLIKVPHVDEHIYVNRKQSHSISFWTWLQSGLEVHMIVSCGNIQA